MSHFLDNNITVFKFGGASVKDAAGVRNLHSILQLHSGKPLFVVISAMGKTTNLLEKILQAYFYQKESPTPLFNQLKNNHLQIINDLGCPALTEAVEPIFSQLETKLQSPPTNCYEFEYDQLVSFGEIISTTLISQYLQSQGMDNLWLDARKVIRTDRTYTEAKIQWEDSERLLKEALTAQANTPQLCITQGFIAGAADGTATTFGREGSDYSAAIIAYILNGKSVTIWKDVPGLLNADPKFFPDAVKLESISYEEAIELAYYGATVIHPKTLKPLQNKNIPLYVKPFLAPMESGSIISSNGASENIPSYIFKRDQILITLFPKDFSFISVNNLSEIFGILSRNGVKMNLMQNTALSFSICTDLNPHRIPQVLEQLGENFIVKYNENMELITIRHYTDATIAKVVGNRPVFAEQRSRTTVQMVVKPQ